MASIAAYLGPALEVSRIVEAEPSNTTLHDRFRRPFSSAWYPDDGRPAPVRFVSRMPVAVDDPALDVPRRFASECVVAHLGPDGEHEGQPFTAGPLTFAWDGVLEAYADVFEPPLIERLSPEARHVTTRRSPAALLFSTWLDHLQGRTDADALADGLERMVGALQDLALTRRVAATFAVVATNGQCLVTLRTGTDQTLPPLYTIVASDGEGPLPNTGRVVATEPTFPGAWTSLEPHSLTIFTLEDAVSGRDAAPAGDEPPDATE